jgi:predicted MFS family arabinose efflux permease
LYLFCYYAGSSVAGTAGGVFWHQWGWNGIGLFIGSLLAVALLVALHLQRWRRRQHERVERALPRDVISGSAESTC